MNDTRKMKGLNSQLQKLNEEKELLKLEIKSKQKVLVAKNDSIALLMKEIQNCQGNGEIKVSEHAILRYLERLEGISIEEVEGKILTPEVLRMVDTLGGNGKFPLGENTLILKDYTIVTIV